MIAECLATGAITALVVSFIMSYLNGRAITARAKIIVENGHCPTCGGQLITEAYLKNIERAEKSVENEPTMGFKPRRCNEEDIN